MTRHALIALLLLGTACVPAAQAQLAATTAGSNRALSAEARAKALVAAMTTQEKLAIVHGYFPPMAKPPQPIAMIPSAGHIPGIPRLGIPTLRESDASLG
ncbi:hypothetical protein LTR94_035323, partial [Friedmanniomyces endolithicus]